MAATAPALTEDVYKRQGTLDEKVALLITYLRGMNDDLKIPHCIKTVSYTHLDVYKRQLRDDQ